MDMYVSKEKDLAEENFPLLLDALQKFCRHYYPAREIIPFLGSHQAGVEGNPPINLNLLSSYVRIASKYSTHGRYIVWGQDTPAIHALSRLLMGKPVDMAAVQRDIARDDELEAVRQLLQKSVKGTKEEPPAPPKSPVGATDQKGN